MTPTTGCDVPSDSSQPKAARSTLVSRNVTIAGHRTSVRLEPEMWSGLSEICRRERTIMHEVCTAVSTRKQPNTSLTAAIRVFVMAYFRSAATEDGHVKAGHGYGVSITGGSGGSTIPPRQQNAMNANNPPPLVMATGKMDGIVRRF